jgi:plasmid stabilization system protein ParE
MPAGSSPKRERQYEHIKESYEDRGVDKDEAEERAARTVNRQRREHGETKSPSK